MLEGATRLALSQRPLVLRLAVSRAWFVEGRKPRWFARAQKRFSIGLRSKLRPAVAKY